MGCRRNKKWNSGLIMETDVTPYIFEISAFTKEECERITRIGLKNRAAQTYESIVTCIQNDFENEWLYGKVSELIKEMNSSYFKFELYDIKSNLHEPLGVLSFRPEKGYHDYHTDVCYDINPVRKLTVSIQLSDENAYEGGELELSYGLNYKTGMHYITEMPRQQGTITCFPSFLVHRVKPLTRGIRHSLVIWVSGPRFK